MLKHPPYDADVRKILMMFQKTVRRETSCIGVGLHSGRRVSLTLKPAPAHTGIVFRRTDLGGIEIPASVEHLASINHATCLALGQARIETVEHLLAALMTLGLDNVVIDLDAAEVPIMDGSAAPFIYLIHEAGIKDLAVLRQFLRITRPVSVEHGGRLVAVYPSDALRVSYTINFNHPLLRHQEFSLEIDESSFVEEIAPARTFGFQRDVEMLRQNGLALGGSLDNAVVLSETGVLNNPLRFPDEFVRHKILDVLGDLALVGMPLLGHVVAVRAGHSLHTELSQEILNRTDSWEWVTLGEPAIAAAPAGAPSLAKVTVR